MALALVGAAAQKVVAGLLVLGDGEVAEEHVGARTDLVALGRLDDPESELGGSDVVTVALGPDGLDEGDPVHEDFGLLAAEADGLLDEHLVLRTSQIGEPPGPDDMNRGVRCPVVPLAHGLHDVVVGVIESLGGERGVVAPREHRLVVLFDQAEEAVHRFVRPVGGGFGRQLLHLTGQRVVASAASDDAGLPKQPREHAAPTLCLVDLERSTLDLVDETVDSRLIGRLLAPDGVQDRQLRDEHGVEWGVPLGESVEGHAPDGCQASVRRAKPLLDHLDGHVEPPPITAGCVLFRYGKIRHEDREQLVLRQVDPVEGGRLEIVEPSEPLVPVAGQRTLDLADLLRIRRFIAGPL